MKQFMIFCLVGLAMAFLPSLGSSASATVLTSEGANYTGKITAEATHVYLHRHKFFEQGIDMTCNRSQLEAQVVNHGSAVTAFAKITSLVFLECASGSFLTTTTTLKPGALELHTAQEEPGTSGNATATLAETLEITTSWKSIIGSEHCIYKLANGDLGTLTGSKSTGGTAKLDVDALLTTGLFCGLKAELTATYTITTPDNLNVD